MFRLVIILIPFLIILSIAIFLFMPCFFTKKFRIVKNSKGLYQIKRQHKILRVWVLVAETLKKEDAFEILEKIKQGDKILYEDVDPGKEEEKCKIK